VPSNYSLFKNASARSARINNQSGDDSDELSPRPAARRSNSAGSAARAMRLADEERKQREAEASAPGAGERAEQSVKSGRQVNVGLRAGGGTPFERAKKPDPKSETTAVEAEPAATPAKKSEDSGVFSKLFSLFGGSS